MSAGRGIIVSYIISNTLNSPYAVPALSFYNNIQITINIGKLVLNVCITC